MTRERRLPDRGAEIAQLRDLMQRMDARISLMEERQDFSEALLYPGDRPRLPALGDDPPTSRNGPKDPG